MFADNFEIMLLSLTIFKLSVKNIAPTHHFNFAPPLVRSNILSVNQYILYIPILRIVQKITKKLRFFWKFYTILHLTFKTYMDFIFNYQYKYVSNMFKKYIIWGNYSNLKYPGLWLQKNTTLKMFTLNHN